MSELIDYVTSNVTRGECRCGKCFDDSGSPELHQPSGHTSDLVFFKVASTGSADKEKLKELIKAHKGEYNEVDPFDGKEHSYIELGGWVGDQGIALMLMGLGEILGIWKLMTPKTVFKNFPEDMQMQMAGNGYVTILAA